MGRKRKTRWRRLSIGEISANEDEDGELGVAVISLTRSHSHSASQNHSPARHASDKPLITMTNNNKDSTASSPSLHNSSTNLSTAPGGAGGTNGGASQNSAKSLNSNGSNSSTPPISSDKQQIGPQNSSSSSNPSSPSHSQNHSGYHNGHHHNHVPSYNNSAHPPPYSVSSNESTSSGGGGGGDGRPHYNDRYHYTRENYRPPHHHHHHHHHHHNHHHGSNYAGGSSSNYQGGGGTAAAEGTSGGGASSSSRGERYHGYSGHPHGSHKDYQNGYHGPGGHYSGYQGGSTYYRNSHSSYRNSHYNSGSSGGPGSGGAGGEPYNNGDGSEGYHYPPSRPYGSRFRKSRSYPASSYYYTNGSTKAGGGAGNNTTDNINRPSYNQDEYTKITTPRQDVLFKKGYLSQKKTQPSSSSVDSASAATTPSASTNGTPDTQSTNGINSDNSEGYENGETDYVIPYDDTIYYAPPPPEAVFTDPNTGQVYYGHCSSTGEYYDAYPVSPVMVAAGYPPMYYPMVPYAPCPIDWNGVPTAAPLYPIVAAPPGPAQLPPAEDSSQLSPGLQGLESSPATTTNPNTNSDTTSSSSAAANAGGAVTATTTSTTTSPSDADLSSDAEISVSNTIKTDSLEGDGEEECGHSCDGDSNSNKGGVGSDSGIDCGSSVADESVSSSAATSQGNSSGAEEECCGGGATGTGESGAKKVIEEKGNVRAKKQSKQQQQQQQSTSVNNNNNNAGMKDAVGKGKTGGKGESSEDNNNEGNKIAGKLEKLHLSKEYSSSESVLSLSTASDKKKDDDSASSGKNTVVDVSTVSPAPSAITTPHNNYPPPIKGLTAMVITSHPQHLTTTALTYNTTGGPHPQAIPVATAPVMTTVPMQMGCPPVMIAAAPNGMPIPPLVPAAPLHPMVHPPQHHHPSQPPPQSQGGNSGPGGHHHSHPHHHPQHSGGGGNGAPHYNSHGPPPHHNHHGHHHPSSHPPPHHHPSHHHHSSHPPPHHHSNYSHHHSNHNHNPRHHGPSSHHPPHHQPHHQTHQQHHHMPPPPPHHQPNPSQQQAPPAAPVPPPPNAVAIGAASGPPPPPPPGATPYHVYPHPTAYIYGPPVYNDEGCSGAPTTTVIGEHCENLTTTGKAVASASSSEASASTTFSSTYHPPNEKGKVFGNPDGEEEKEEKASTKEAETVEETIGRGDRSVVETVTVTSPEKEEEERKQSCDSKIIASKTLTSEGKKKEKGMTTRAHSAEKTKTDAAQVADNISYSMMSKAKSDEISVTGRKEKSLALEQNGAIGMAMAVEEQLKNGMMMNKEIEIQTEKKEVSRPDEKLGVGISSSSSSSPLNLVEMTVAASQVIGEGKEQVCTSSLLPSSSSLSPSCSSSTNESSSSISSPVNEGRSLIMRSQSKLASRKNFTESEKVDKDPEGVRPTSEKVSKSASSSKRKSKKKGKSEKDDTSIFLDKGQAKQMGMKEEGTDENDKTSSSQSQSGEEQQQQQQGQEDSSSTTSPADNNGGDVENSTLLDSVVVQQSESGSGGVSKKPIDLTVQCPGNDELHQSYEESLHLQRSPSVANEPSSPDSLNTNQSVAGSEFCPGENLSVSESDLMNRTTSIDEVEEDLPQETEFPPPPPPASTSQSLMGTGQVDDGTLKASLDIPTNPPVTLELEEQSQPLYNVEVEEEEKALENNQTACQVDDGQKTDTTKESEKQEEESNEAPSSSSSSRPQSITLAVTEWLKTQGDDALTPIIPRVSSSDEFEGDVEETDSDEDDDSDSIENEDGNGRKKRDDSTSNLEQNQKNVYGNPWVAPSNKSGTTSFVVKQARKRSSVPRKCAKKIENDEAQIGTTTTTAGLQKKDGVCSRVAPINAKAAAEIITTTATTSTAQIISTCSANTSDDPDDNMTESTDNFSFRRKDKHNSSVNYLNKTSSSKSMKNDEGKKRVMKDYYDSGLELSSPENTSSSSVLPISKSTQEAVNKKSNNLANIEHHHHRLDDDDDGESEALPIDPVSSPVLIAKKEENNNDEKYYDRASLPKLISSCCDQKERINPDRIVIAAPLSIIRQQKAGNEDPSTSSLSEQRPIFMENASVDNKNNNVGTSVASSSLPSSATSVVDERDHAEICDPQRYAKYYQFGVVYDTSSEADPGIDTAQEEDDNDSLDDDDGFIEDITLDFAHSSNSSPAKIPSQPQPQEDSKEIGETSNNNTDFLTIMTQRNRKLARKARHYQHHSHQESDEDILVSKSIYLQDEDEEIGTYDPQIILESRRQRQRQSSEADVAGESAEQRATSSTVPQLSSSHLYVNPLSLAAEMKESTGAGDHQAKAKKMMDASETSSFDSSSEEPPLPPYESPPSVEIPVYNENTPAARVIRRNFYAIGDPVSGAICCSIQ